MRPVDAFRTTLDLHATGVEMERQTLRRTYPSASEAEIARRLQDWLRHRPGAETGDADGRLVDLRSRPR